MNEKRKEKKVNQATDLGENAFSVSSEREYNCDSLFALFLEIIRNISGNYKTALVAVFTLLVTQWVSCMMDICV